MQYIQIAQLMQGPLNSGKHDVMSIATRKHTRSKKTWYYIITKENFAQ